MLFKFPVSNVGHILIYDIINNDIYNIRHPIFDEFNKNEKLIETTYILGEDYNIYFQLVTDRGYYIYRIIPKWDLEYETIQYMTYFIEMYPHLKKIWDEN